jgi:hypothetical protein
MKNKNADETAKAQRKSKSPIPAWADPELKPAFEKMLPGERIACAERLEHQAAQLREMKPAPVRPVCTVAVELRPKMKEAIMAFACFHGAKSDKDEKYKLEVGTRWFLESALAIMLAVENETNRRYFYRESEGLEDSDYCERLISDAFAKWTSEIESDSDED